MEILVTASYRKEKGGSRGQENLFKNCIQQNNRKEIAISGEWHDTALRCQEIRLFVFSWNWGLQWSSEGRGEARSYLLQKKWGDDLY